MIMNGVGVVDPGLEPVGLGSACDVNREAGGLCAPWKLG
jgi:hypothetical protein